MERIELYCPKDQVPGLRAAAKDLGVSEAVRWDREARHHYLDLQRLATGSQRLDEAARAGLESVFGAYIGAEAQTKWAAQADMRPGSTIEERTKAAEAQAVRQARSARSREIDPDRLIYPALSQQMEMRQLAEAVGAAVIYRPSQKAFEVVQGDMDKFRIYQTDAAKERFRSEFAERQQARRNVGAEKVSDQEMRDTASAVAASAEGKGFVARYGGLGFMLANPEKKPDRHAAQLREMREASAEELTKIFFVTQRAIEGLRKKELDSRAAALSMPSEELRQKSFAEQKALLKEAGKDFVGLAKEEFHRLQSLGRGLQNLHGRLVELGIFKDREAERAQSPEPEKPVNDAQKAAQRLRGLNDQGRAV